MADDDARYLVLRPQGQEGPFTREDLRSLAETGRLQADERVLDSITRVATTAGELLPGVTRPATEVRVRRSSDRLPVQPAAPRPRSGRTPLPVAPVHADSAPAPEAVAVEPAPARRPPARWAIAVLAAAAVFVLAMAALALRQPAGPDPHRLQPGGVWRAQAPGSAAGAWLVAVAGDSAMITAPDGTRFASGCVRTALDDVHCVLELDPPHPVLGRRLVLTVSGVGCALGELPATYAPPL